MRALEHPGRNVTASTSNIAAIRGRGPPQPLKNRSLFRLTIRFLFPSVRPERQLHWQPTQPHRPAYKAIAVLIVRNVRKTECPDPLDFLLETFYILTNRLALSEEDGLIPERIVASWISLGTPRP